MEVAASSDSQKPDQRAAWSSDCSELRREAVVKQRGELRSFPLG